MSGITKLWCPSPRKDDVVTVDRTDTPAGYRAWLAALKTRIREAWLHASLAVNAELIGLHWRIGRDILERQQRDGWSAKLVDRLTLDLQSEFPGIRGVSRALNYWMRVVHRSGRSLSTSCQATQT